MSKGKGKHSAVISPDEVNDFLRRNGMEKPEAASEEDRFECFVKGLFKVKPPINNKKKKKAATE